MQFYCAEQVVNILFASTGLKAANPEGQAPISEAKQQQVISIQNINNEYDLELDAIFAEQHKLIEQAQTQSKNAIQGWRELIDDSTNKIIAKLTELGFNLSANFSEKLNERLNKRGADIFIPDDALTEFHIRERLTGIERAIIGTLLEEIRHG